MRKRLAGALLACLIGVVAVAPAAEARCRTYTHRAKVESFLFKTDLAYLYITRRYCFNGRRITKVGTLRIQPRFTDNSINQSWEGLDYPPVSKYMRWNGRRRGSHYSKAAGSFKQEICLGPCYTAISHVWVAMRVYGNGGVTKTRENG